VRKQPKQARGFSSCALAWVPVLVVAGVLGGVAEALAQEAPTVERTSVAAGFFYGTDELDLGFGARGGYTLGTGLYLGGALDFHMGREEELFWGEIDRKFWSSLAAVGYDLVLVESLVVRPQVQLGALGVIQDCPEADTPVNCDHDVGFEAALGGQLFYAIGVVTVGTELRLLLGNWDALVFGLDVGLIL